MLYGREGTHRHLPNYLEASSPKRLFDKLKKLQRKEQVEYRYISFYYDPSSEKHVAWFYRIIDETEELREVINGITTE